MPRRTRSASTRGNRRRKKSRVFFRSSKSLPEQGLCSTRSDQRKLLARESWGKEMPSSGARVVRFGPFEVDRRARELRRDGRRVRLQIQPFQVLNALLERA